MLNLKIAVLLLSLGQLSKAGLVPFTDCGSEYELNSVDIHGCNSFPCKLYIGTQQRITMNLTATHRSKALKQNVEFILRGIHVNITVTPENPCDLIKCPVANNYDASFRATMDLNNSGLVQLDGNLKWIITNDDKVVLMCMKTPILVKYSYNKISEDQENQNSIWKKIFSHRYPQIQNK